MSVGRYPFPTREEAANKLKRDYCYHKIPPEKIPELIDMSWNAGVDAAHDFLKEWGGQPLNFIQVLEKSGVQIVTEEKDYISGQLRYFAEIQPKAKRAVLYRHSAELWAENNGYSYEDARNMILMHEYFHYLEYVKLGYTSKRYQVPMLELFGLKLGSTGIAALSEIAADAFAGELFSQIDHEEEHCKACVPEKKGPVSQESEDKGAMNGYAKVSFYLSVLMLLVNGICAVRLIFTDVPAANDLWLSLVLGCLLFAMFCYQCIRERQIKKATFLSVVVFAVCGILLLLVLW